MNVKDTWQSARALEEDGKFDQARAAYSQLIDHSPSPEGELFFRRGFCELGLERFQEAIDDFSTAIQLGMQGEAAYALRADAYIQLAGFELAADDLARALAFNSQHVPYYLLRASCYLALGQPKRALADYSHAVDLSPTAETHHARAAVYLATGNANAAIDDYTQAIQLDGSHTLSYMGRALAYQELGQLAEAVGDLCFVVQIAPSPQSLLARGNLYVRLGLIDKALQDYSSAIDREPNKAGLYLNRATAYMLAAGYGKVGAELEPNKMQAALTDLDQAVELDAASSDALAARARLKNALNDHRAAVEDATRALSFNPSHRLALHERVIAYKALGDNELAKEDFLKLDQIHSP